MRNIRGPLKIVLEIFFQSIAKLLPGLHYSPHLQVLKKKKNDPSIHLENTISKHKGPSNKNRWRKIKENHLLNRKPK